MSLRRHGIRLAFVLAVLGILPMPAAAAGETDPHYMRNADGSTDDAKCGVCHNDDLGLLRSKLETCTVCHAETTHSGSREHVQASAAAVARLMAGAKGKDPELPLTDDGRIYCGTCHLFHDPVVASEALLQKGRSPSGSSVGIAVAEALRSRWPQLAKAHGHDEANIKLNPQGTLRLRLPNADGSLCRHCHSGY